tara:strand:+ start:359 stop:520 length:162 start_codon:yes stop_codon:yes gene_type:complete
MFGCLDVGLLVDVDTYERVGWMDMTRASNKSINHESIETSSQLIDLIDKLIAC